MYKVTDEDVPTFLSVISKGTGGFRPSVKAALQSFVDENGLREGLTGHMINSAVEAYNTAHEQEFHGNCVARGETLLSKCREHGIKAFLGSIKANEKSIREPKIVGKTSDAMVVDDPAGPNPLPLFKAEYLRTSPAVSGWIYFRCVDKTTWAISVSCVDAFGLDENGHAWVETDAHELFVAESDRDIVFSHLMAALNVKDLTGGVE